MDISEQGDLDDLHILFPKYTKSELEPIYLTRGKDFKQTCAFIIHNMSNNTQGSSSAADRAASLASAALQNQTIKKVMKMASSAGPAQLVAKKFGMNISTVTWEDCARTENSCWGPCICDMTLRVPEDNCLPVIRYPNFNDLTWDVPIEKIFLMIGNETGTKELIRVGLKEYLITRSGTLESPVMSSRQSWYCKEKDSHVLVSAQACMLPAAIGSEPSFNVALYSYQTYSADNPAVLTILASAQGTSVQTIGERTEKLYFNKNGRKASFVGQRLSDNRKERVVATEGAMTAEEKEANMIMLIQVPLKQKERRMRHIRYKACSMKSAPYFESCLGEDDACQDYYDEECCEDMADVEDVIVKVSDKDEGPFPVVKERQGLTRDTRYPIRVTLQFYKATSNGILDSKTMESIADQFVVAQNDADFIGSLVTGNSVHRPTRPNN